MFATEKPSADLRRFLRPVGTAEGGALLSNVLIILLRSVSLFALKSAVSRLLVFLNAVIKSESENSKVIGGNSVSELQSLNAVSRIPNVFLIPFKEKE